MQTREQFLTGVAALATCGALSAFAERPAQAASVRIAVDRSRLGMPLGSEFTGLSYKKSYLSAPLFRPDNAALVRLYRMIGPSIIRVGGTAVDRTAWSRTGRGRMSGVVAGPDVDAFAAFLRATGWKVLYGINMAQNTPANAADEARYASRQFGDLLYALEIGNEPDQYRKQYGGSLGTYAGFRSAWDAFASAIKAAVPNAALTGPATSHRTEEYTVPFARDEAGRIALLTQHYYRASGKKRSSTIEKLLTPDPRLDETLDMLREATEENRIPGYRITECGSFAGGGRPGVSNAYGSALWALDFLFTLAQHGAEGANFHCAGGGRAYDPIADDGTSVTEVRPGYYGMLFFSRLGSGRIAAANVENAPPGFTAYAVARHDGGTSVAAINTGFQTVSTDVVLDRRATRASTLVLTGPSMLASNGVTLGGAAIGTDGSWRPAQDARGLEGNTVTATVPAGSAVLIEAH
jgi:hypothetical protein